MQSKITEAVILFVVFVTIFRKGSARSLKLVGVEKASALYKFRELAMHRHVGLLTDINGSVTDELPIKYIVSSV